MEERLYEIQRFYIQHDGERRYTAEFLGRGQQTTRLTFEDVEGIEFSSQGGAEIQTAFCNLNDEPPRIWNVRFSFPVHLSVRFTGKIVIQVR